MKMSFYHNMLLKEKYVQQYFVCILQNGISDHFSSQQQHLNQEYFLKIFPQIFLVAQNDPLIDY